MGSKRVGIARVEAMLENLKREINWGTETTFKGRKRKVISLDNASAAVTRTLATGESGALVFLNVTSDTGSRGISVILPAPVAGVSYDFVIADAGNGTNDITIKTSADAVDIKGVFLSKKDGVEGSTFSASTLVLDISDTGTKTDLDGTSFTLVSDGSHYYTLGGLTYGGEDASGTGFEPAAGTDVDD